jgi:hypothetical protein
MAPRLCLPVVAALVLTAAAAAADEPPAAAPVAPGASTAPPPPAPTAAPQAPFPQYAWPQTPLGAQPPAAAAQPWGALPPGYYYPPPSPGPVSVRRSIGALVGGIVLLSAGLTSVIVAATFFRHEDQTCAFNGSGFDCSSPSVGPGVVTALVVGIAGALAGVPLIVYGAQPVRVSRATGGAGRELSPWAGAPTGSGWRWSF